MENVLGPCRLPYEFISKQINSDNSNSSTPDTQILSKGYCLSTKDLCSLSFLPELINAGVVCFKIEGRLKNPEYVATVTRIYRKYIDLALSNNPYIIDDKDIEELAQVFNRGNFSSGHLNNDANKELVYSKTPSHIGIYVGNISNLKPNKGHVFFNLTNCISLGDTVQFEKESTKYTISELMVKEKNIPTANKGQLVEIGRMKGNLHIGDKIYKISSKELSNIALSSFQEEHKKIKLDATVTIKKNSPVSIEVNTINSDNYIFNDIKVRFTSEDIPVDAKSKPLDKERILSQINKTKDTIFEFKNINVVLDDNLFLPSIKCLNELRRTALEEILTTAKTRILRRTPSLSDLQDFSKSPTKNKKTNNKKISILLNILNENIDYTNLKNVDNAYIPLKYFSNKIFENTIKDICANFNTYIYLPTIIKSNYKNLLGNVIDNSINKFNIKGFVISNLSNATFISDMKEKYLDRYEFIGNYTLNIYNNYSESEWQKLGVKKLTISPELDKITIEDILKFSNLEQELIVYGNTPLMSINYCLLGKTNKCYPTCGVHCKDNKKYYLKDRLGLLFRVIPDSIQTVTTIYNSKITSILPSSFTSSSYRIDLLDESIDDINTIVTNILADKRLEGKDFTNGNLNREV
ncbi:MAG: U32 family peptidase [Clostridiaceae bacterium]|nr:U32 family peptidase [Clostridiaceae bacterium]